jgi:hypothetical protein
VIRKREFKKGSELVYLCGAGGGEGRVGVEGSGRQRANFQNVGRTVDVGVRVAGVGGAGAVRYYFR